MAVYVAKISVADDAFPLISRWEGRPVLIPNVDTTQLQTKALNDRDVFNAIKQPHVIFVQNAIPKNGGFASVGFATYLTSVSNGLFGNRLAFNIRVHDDLENSGTIAGYDVDYFPPVDGVMLFSAANNPTYGNFIAEYVTERGTDVTTLPNAGDLAIEYPEYISRALINDTTLFMFAAKQGLAYTNVYYLQTHAGSTHVSFNEITFTGISTDDLLGCKFMCGAGNYLIMAKPDGTIFWSNPLDYTDFTPSLSTGAGFEVPSMLFGEVIGIQQWMDGFLICTTQGNLIARYSQNAQLPWVFIALPGAMPVMKSAVTGRLAITNVPTDQLIFAYTTAGMQEFSIMSGANNIFPEVGDFFAAECYESLVNGKPVFNQNTETASDEDSMDVMLTRVSARYLVISYGSKNSPTIPLGNPAYFPFALIYDTVLNRWGKVQFNHVEVIVMPTTLDGIEPLQQLGFLSDTGDIVVMTTEDSFNVGGVLQAVTHAGTVIIGGAALVRSNTSQLNYVEANYGDVNPSVTCSYLSSPDAINWSDATPLEQIIANTGSGKWGARKIAGYHGVNITGKFLLTEIQLALSKTGNR